MFRPELPNRNYEVMDYAKGERRLRGLRRPDLIAMAVVVFANGCLLLAAKADRVGNSRPFLALFVNPVLNGVLLFGGLFATAIIGSPPEKVFRRYMKVILLWPLCAAVLAFLGMFLL